MSSNCLVFHTSGGISSSPAAFLFLIFLRTESSSSCVNGPSLMSNCLLIILVIGSCVIFGGFPSRFSKCCFHSFILSCWFAAFSFALAMFFAPNLHSTNQFHPFAPPPLSVLGFLLPSPKGIGISLTTSIFHPGTIPHCRRDRNVKEC